MTMTKKRVLIFIDKDLDHEFRKLAYEVFGYSHGTLSKAFEEAMRLWIYIRKHCKTDSSVCAYFETDECPLMRLLNK